jgi:signal transduction histidine kinase
MTKEKALSRKPSNIQIAADLCQTTRCIPTGTQNREVFAIFNADPTLQSLPVVDDKSICGLINRERFMGRMAKRFHWELYGKKRCVKMMDVDPLVVDAETSISEIANLLLGNGEARVLSDSFVIARGGVLLGIGYTSGVLSTLLQHERQASAELRLHHDRLSELVEERTRDLMLAKQAAEQANRAKSEFLTNMSHELRTPLHAVLAFAKFGSDKSAEGSRDKLGQYFARINESAERLTRLVNDLLDLSRLDAVTLVLNRVPADLGELAGQALAKAIPLAAQRQIELRLTKEVKLAPICCDIKRVHQMLAHILGNAIKFSGEGSRVVLHISAYLSDNPSVAGYQLEIIDQGPGIPEGELDSIFERFTQSSKTRTGAGGSGLGLPISREIMRLHQGHITASNHAAGGACFLMVFHAA